MLIKIGYKVYIDVQQQNFNFFIFKYSSIRLKKIIVLNKIEIKKNWQDKFQAYNHLA